MWSVKVILAIISGLNLLGRNQLTNSGTTLAARLYFPSGAAIRTGLPFQNHKLQFPKVYMRLVLIHVINKINKTATVKKNLNTNLFDIWF